MQRLNSSVDSVKIDWFRVIVDLSRHGYSNLSIAAAIDVPKSTMRGWKQGAEPKHSDGERLIVLWCQVMDQERERLPSVNRFSWRA